MKYHPIFKALAIFLAAAALLVCAAGAAGGLFLLDHGLYTENLETWLDTQRDMVARDLAREVLNRYTARTFSGCPAELLSALGYDNSDQTISGYFDLDTDDWLYQIYDAGGVCVDGTAEGPTAENMILHSFETSSRYPVLLMEKEIGETAAVVPEGDVTVDFTERPVPLEFDEAYTWDSYAIDLNGREYYYNFVSSPQYTVKVWLTSANVGYYHRSVIQLLTWLYSYRMACIWLCVSGLLAFALFMVYLCFAAGRSRKNGTCRAGGLNRLPLDLYLLLAGSIGISAAVAGVALLDECLWQLQNGREVMPECLVLAVLAFLTTAVMVVGFFFAIAAQLKTPDHFWWKNSVLGRILRLIGRLFRFLFRAVRQLFCLLPLMWQWILTAAAMVVTPAVFCLLAYNSYGLMEMLNVLSLIASLLGDIALVCYGAYAFGTLRRGARTMSQGDLAHKLPTKYLVGCFRQLANHLNTVSDAARVAAQKEMRSERMKTELITNVSHDIKTPLTSLINYVDLLQKPHTEEEGRQYLEVLDRQSQRLKKLIDDLMEMSKASTGNMTVLPTALDMTETVNQALGEFADKLARADLRVVFAPPAEPVRITADGRLTWRVLSNVLSNVVKYALPGTRVYLDIGRYNGHVLLSVKNISREALNVSAQELTERFVRGDASRNTEGSGLGLNIAQSLMELQRGKLNLLVDGDLFKVTLTFPE